MLTPSNASFEQRECAVDELHRGAFGGLDRVGDLEQAQRDLLVGSEHLAGGDPEQDGVADLAGRARYSDVRGHLGVLLVSIGDATYQRVVALAAQRAARSLRRDGDVAAPAVARQ